MERTITYRGASLLGATVLATASVCGFALSAVANRLEFLLLGLGTATVMALLRLRGTGVTGIAFSGIVALMITATLVRWHGEELRLGLAAYGAPLSLGRPALWAGAALFVATGVVLNWLIRRVGS